MPDFRFGADARGAALDARFRGAAFLVVLADFVALSEVFAADVALRPVAPVVFLGRLLEPVFLVAMLIPPGVLVGYG
jgi:hypothetical protein